MDRDNPFLEFILGALESLVNSPRIKKAFGFHGFHNKHIGGD